MNRILTIALTASSVVLAACGGKDSTGLGSISGTYTLETVNGAQLPFTTDEDATYKAEILSSSITLRENRTFSWVFTGRSTDNGVATTNSDTIDGTYTVSGSTLTLTDPDGSATATLSTDTITMVIDGPVGTFRLVFSR